MLENTEKLISTELEHSASIQHDCESSLPPGSSGDFRATWPVWLDGYELAAYVNNERPEGVVIIARSNVLALGDYPKNGDISWRSKESVNRQINGSPLQDLSDDTLFVASR